MDYPFRSDGCSFIEPIYRAFGRIPPGRDYCIMHDVDYWAGGTFREFCYANRIFRDRLSRSGYPVLAWLRWGAVQIGGLPCWPLPWRWGFGHAYWRFRLFSPISASDAARLTRERKVQHYRIERRRAADRVEVDDAG